MQRPETADLATDPSQVGEIALDFLATESQVGEIATSHG
jgi:hypothetical protein